MTESVEDDPLTEDDYETGDPTSPGVKALQVCGLIRLAIGIL